MILFKGLRKALSANLAGRVNSPVLVSIAHNTYRVNLYFPLSTILLDVLVQYLHGMHLTVALVEAVNEKYTLQNLTL